jgi:hypothetical protein
MRGTLDEGGRPRLLMGWNGLNDLALHIGQAIGCPCNTSEFFARARKLLNVFYTRVIGPNSSQSTKWDSESPQLVKMMEGLGRGGFRSGRISHLFSAALNEGPDTTTQHVICDGTFSHFNGGVLAVRHEMQFKFGHP